MDSYQKIKCVQGLIISLDEQIQRLDHGKESAPSESYKIVIQQYKEAMIEQLTKDDNEKT